MRSCPLITHLKFFPGGWDDLRSGLLGYLQFKVAGLLDVDGATVRQTADGRITISWPKRRDAYGIDHPVVRPCDSTTKAEIEAELLAHVADWLPGGQR